MSENPYSDISFWLQRNWSWMHHQYEPFGMYFWTKQC